MPPQNRRQACRYATIEEHQDAVLEVKGARIPARILDESATGFRLEVERPAPIQHGDVLTLRAHTGSCEVEVVNMRSEEDYIRFGVRRLDDLIDENEDFDRSSSQLSLIQPMRMRVAGLLSLPILGFAGLVVFAAVCAVAFSRPAGELSPKAAYGRWSKARTTVAESVEIREGLLLARVRTLENLNSSRRRAEELRLKEFELESLRRIVQPFLERARRPDASLLDKERAVQQAYAEVLDKLTPEQRWRFLREIE
jgi:hypothetical protein